jgi:hypothetical protein
LTSDVSSRSEDLEALVKAYAFNVTGTDAHNRSKSEDLTGSVSQL